MKINMQFRKPTVWGRYLTALITFMAVVGAREDGFEVSDTANGADLYLSTVSLRRESTAADMRCIAGIFSFA